MKSFYFALLVSCLVAISLAAQQCGPLAEYKECGCLRTCQNVFGDCDKSKCKPGCYCKQPYVFNRGLCILPHECAEYKHKCKQNEQYLKSGVCEGSCADPDHQLCNRFGRPAGCYCVPPYVRENGKCIHKDKCPKPAEQCKKNETYYEDNDPNNCLYTCDNYNPALYTREFLPAGCYCSPGFVSHNGACIPHSQCPSKPQPPKEPDHQCAQNEQYIVGRITQCEGTCQDPKPDFCIRDFRDDAGEGCYCLAPFVLDNGKCIHKDKCPVNPKPAIQCAQNETYYEENDPNNCRYTCKFYMPGFCTREFLPAGCYCSPGLVEHNGACIPYSQCPSQKPQPPTEPATKCSRNEVYRKEGEAVCERTCEQPDIAFCHEQFLEAGCYCEPPFVRMNGHCIDKRECPIPV